MNKTETLPSLWIEAHAAGDKLISGLREEDDRLARLRRSNEKILREYPADLFVPLIRRRLRPRMLFIPARWAALACTTAAVALFTFWPATEGVRLKGGTPSLIVYRERFPSYERLTAGSRATEKDRIQLAYRLASPAYGMIISLDRRGHLTVHLPRAGGTSAPLTSGREVLLDSAFELDDGPDFEKFLLVTGTSAFEVETVAKRIQSHLPIDQTVEEFSLQKEMRP